MILLVMANEQSRAQILNLALGSQGANCSFVGGYYLSSFVGPRDVSSLENGIRESDNLVMSCRVLVKATNLAH